MRRRSYPALLAIVVLATYQAAPWAQASGGTGGSSAAGTEPTTPPRTNDPDAENIKAGSSGSANGTTVFNALASGPAVVTLTGSGDVRCQAGTSTVIDTTQPNSVQIGSNCASAINGYASPVRITGPGSTVYVRNTHSGANMSVKVEYGTTKKSYSIPPGGSKTIQS